MKKYLFIVLLVGLTSGQVSNPCEDERFIKISEKLQNEMINILLFGRSTGKTWFMTDVFRDVFERIEKLNS